MCPTFWTAPAPRLATSHLSASGKPHVPTWIQLVTSSTRSRYLEKRTNSGVVVLHGLHHGLRLEWTFEQAECVPQAGQPMCPRSYQYVVLMKRKCSMQKVRSVHPFVTCFGHDKYVIECSGCNKVCTLAFHNFTDSFKEISKRGGTTVIFKLRNFRYCQTA